MEPENSDLMVHDMIGRLFDGPEPAHRADLADGAIAGGVAATRRRGFAVAGATLSVLAVVGGAVALAGGVHGSGGDWSVESSGPVSTQAYENDAPTYADRQREIYERLRGVLGPLLPAGFTFMDDPKIADGGMFDKQTGDYSQLVQLRWLGSEYHLRIDTDGYASEKYVLGPAGAKPIAVAGGSIRMATKQAETDYEYIPSDPAAPKIYIEISSDDPSATTPAIDEAGFKAMVQAPGFAALRWLLDPSVPASAAAVRERYAIEAKVNAEAAKVLPPGFRFKLSPGTPGELELVGPEGVNGFDWYSHDDQPGSGCSAGALCYGDSHARPDGKARLGWYTYGAGTASDPAITVRVIGLPMPGHQQTEDLPLGKNVETAPLGPGLTPQEAMAIVKAPGVSRVIADVQKLAAMPR
jgi:hypothetical protein